MFVLIGAVFTDKALKFLLMVSPNRIEIVFWYFQRESLPPTSSVFAQSVLMVTSRS